MTEHNQLLNRILIAEDDPVSRRLLQAFLAKWGYEVLVASDGIQALQILAADHAPALAILDWMMPGLEGPEVCQRLRQLPERPYTYVLLLTAKSQKGDLLRGLEAGADDYLTKPFDALELRARLQVGKRILALQDRLIAAREELRFRATHDPLTGLANRAVALDALHRECSRQVREHNSLGVIMLDLDHFKNINDTHGHLSGDAVLKEAARRIGQCVRPYDTVGRYGGEEFLVVAPSCDGPATLALAERIRLVIEGAPVGGERGPVRVTASCGVAVSGGLTPAASQELLQLADTALYEAKNQGRNRSVLASPANAEGTCSPPPDLPALKLAPR